MNQVRSAGIDVSAKTLVVSYQATPQSKVHTWEVANTAQGHLQLCRKLQQTSSPLQVCLEATGNYSLDVAVALHQHGIPVMVLNPRAAKDFARSLQNRSKTDVVDSLALLTYAQRMKFRPWQPPRQALLQLRDLSRRIKALTKQSAQEKNRLEAATACQGLSPVVQKDIQAHLSYLEGRIGKLLKHACQLIEQSSELRPICQQLTSIKGIAVASATHLMAELLLLPDDMTAKQWVAYAGLDPRHHESGSSIQKLPRISRVGNPLLRNSLFMPALSAVRFDPHVKAFYEKLISRGKAPMQALVAVMRKLLHSIYGMLKTGECFQGQKFFALEAPTP
jgi:transposase